MREGVPTTPPSDTAPKYTEHEGGRGDFLGKIQSGQEVYDRPQSHMRDHGDVSAVLPQVFTQIEIPSPLPPNERTAFPVDLGEVVGQTECVAVKEGDQVVYGMRRGRPGHSRLVINREPEDCSSVVAVVYQPPRQEYFLLATAFIGTPAAREVFERGLQRNPALRRESLRFWMGIGEDNGGLGHALIFDPDKIEPETSLLTECPYDLPLPNPRPTPRLMPPRRRS